MSTAALIDPVIDSAALSTNGSIEVIPVTPAPLIITRSAAVADLARLILSGFATEEQLASAPLAEVRAIKTDSGAIHYRAKSTPTKSSKTDQPRQRQFIASDETVDRMGDVIRVKGWDLTNFEQNPVALFGHNDAFPIGTVAAMTKTRRDGRPVLLETIDYATAEVNQAADGIFRLVDAGIIRAVSVGFIPTKSTWPSSPEERQALGLGPHGCLYEEQEQLELSNVTVPANPSALSAKNARKAVLDMVNRGELAEEVGRWICASTLGDGPKIFALGAPEAATPEHPPADASDVAEPEGDANLGTRASAGAPSDAATGETVELAKAIAALERKIDALDLKLSKALEQKLAPESVAASAAPSSAPADDAENTTGRSRSFYRDVMEDIGRKAGALAKRSPGGAM